MKKLFRTEGHTYIYIANGHGTWEAALTNVLSRGDKILVLESGRFAIGWGEAAAADEGRGRDPERRLEPRGRTRGGRGAAEGRHHGRDQGDPGGAGRHRLGRAVNDIEAIGKAIKSAKHDALLMVDTVASLGCMPFEMDKWGVDVAMSGSQKGLMTPPGPRLCRRQ